MQSEKCDWENAHRKMLIKVEWFNAGKMQSKILRKYLKYFQNKEKVKVQLGKQKYS